MSRRRGLVIPAVIVGSIMFFLFSLAVLINHTVGQMIVGIEDTLVSGLERENGIRIEYDSISLGSFDTLVMKGLRIRHADTNRQAVLASLERADVRLRILSLIFSGDSITSSIASLNIIRPELNVYSDGSLLDNFSNNDNDAIAKSSTGKSVKTALGIKIKDGMVRVYGSDSLNAIPPAAPLAEAGISSASLQVQDNKGSFGIKTDLSVLPSREMITGKVDIDGIIDLDTGSVDALVTASAAQVAGLGLPDLRFFVSREAGQLTVDSSTFGQPVSIDGKWQEGADGSFILTLDRNLRSFDTFVSRTASGLLGKMFFRDSERYSPSGKIALDIGRDGFRMTGNLSIEDGLGRPVFRLATSGNEQILTIERLELSRNEHLISLSGYWDWKGIPHLAAKIRALELDSISLDANCTLHPVADGAIALALDALAVNGRQIGSLSAVLDPAQSQVVFDGFFGTLRGRGDFSGQSTLVSLDLQAFPLGDVAASLTGNSLISGWNLSGPIEVSLGTNGISFEGASVLAIPGQGNIDMKYRYDGNQVQIDTLRSDWFSLTGSAKREYDGASAKFELAYNGRIWPVNAQIKQTGEISRIALDIKDMVSGQADITPDGVRASASLQGVSLAPVGLEGVLTGEATLISRDESMLTGGVFRLRMQDPDLPSLGVTFTGAGTRFDLTRIEVERGGHSLTGGGRVWIDQGGVARCALAFANGLSLQANTIPGGFAAQSEFVNMDLASLLPGMASGLLQGKATFKIENNVPTAAWSLNLKEGSFEGLPLTIQSEATNRPGGIQFGPNSLALGDGKIEIRNGYLVKTQQGLDFLCNGSVFWKGAPFKVESRFLAQGGSSAREDEVILALSGIRFSNNKTMDFSSVITRQGDRFKIRKTGPAGFDGWYNFKNQTLDLRYHNLAGTTIAVAGSHGESLNLKAEVLGLPLTVLENMPQIFRSAKGYAQANMRITGSADQPDISGLVKITNANINLTMLRTPLTELALEASITQGTLTLGHLDAKNGKGKVSIQGKVFVRNGELDEIDARLQTDREYGLDLNLNDPEIRSEGGVLADLFITGNINAPNVQGRIALHDNDFYYMEDSAIPSKENWIKRIRWNMEVAVLDGVSYVNQLITAMLQPGSVLYLKNSIIDKDFLVSGRVVASRGSFDYINHEFRIEQPTYIEFKRTSFGLDPWLAFRGRLRLKDEELENVDIFLTFSGPLSLGINPVFSSEPERTQDEIRVLLGIEQPDVSGVDGRRKSENIMLRSTELISLLGLKPLTKEIREWFGLDIFTIRTPIVRNILERESLDALDPKRQLSIFRDTQFSLGKYLTSFMFVEYTLVLKDDIHNYGDVLPTHQIGLEFSFDFLNLGYLIKPTETSGFDEYEQSIEIRFRQRF